MCVKVGSASDRSKALQSQDIYQNYYRSIDLKQISYIERTLAFRLSPSESKRRSVRDSPGLMQP